MEIRVKVYSKIYLDVDDTTWCARPTKDLMRRLQSQDSARWIAAFDGGRISIGDPVSFIEYDCLFVPGWFMETIGLEDGTEVILTFEKCETLQKATHLSFKVIGQVNDMDIRDLIEEPLSQLGVIEVGQTIPVPLVEDALLLLVNCEPSGTVFLDGANIGLEIEYEASGGVASGSSDFGSMLPSASGSSDFGSMLPSASGSSDFGSMLPSPYNPSSNAFVPFQGLGHRLG